jgi:hypothetical protein
MAYTIVKSDGQVLTTIADGQINTTSSSLGLPGRNYAGYGQVLDENFVYLLENFASTTPPAHPLRGQLWFNTNDNILYVCPADGTTVADDWLSLAIQTAEGNTTFSGVVVTGTLSANNLIITNTASIPTISCTNITVSNVATIQTANITSANIGNVATQVITTGNASIAGTVTGNWTLTTGSRLQATYADLAERFESDLEYDAGTVVELGGSKEITAVKYELSEDVFGVVSNSAAYLMNATAGDDKTHPAVAVTGRVRVKVIGPVYKAQRLVSAGNGLARAAKEGEATAFNTIGRALADKLSESIGTVEAIVTIR